MTPARLRWGLILIQFGVLVLLVNLDVINYNFFPDLVRALPFLLIAIGIEKIFTRSKHEYISYLAVAGLFFGGLYIAYSGSSGNSYSSFFERTNYRQDYDPNVSNLKAVLDLGEGNLTIRDATDDMVVGKFGEWTQKPRIDYEVEDTQANFSLRQGRGRIMDGFISIDGDPDDDWTMYFCKSVPLDLECYGDKSDIHLNLATTPLRQLKLDADDSDVYVKIGNMEPSVAVNLAGSQTDIRLRLPSGAGVEVSAPEFESYLQRIGMVERDGAWFNDQFDSLENKITIDLGSSLDDLKIEFY